MFNPRMFLLIAMILSIFFVPACGRGVNLQDKDKDIVARINDYKLTIDDFKPEMRASLVDNLSDAEFEKAKEDLLDEIIIKKILLQEAQKQNFDKDRAFIKEIERYWEQALLKLLYKKKSQELLREISKYEIDPDIRDRRVRESMDAWVVDLKNRAEIKKYKDNLKTIGR